MRYDRLPNYDKIMNEYFDINDSKTRKILVNVNEADQNQILTALTSKLYDNIVNKVDDIDFGTIPLTKGDITKLQNYDQLNQCIDTIRGILTQYKQDTTPIDTVREALNNILDRTQLWTKAYVYDAELPIVLYNTIVLSIVSSVSFLIASSIEYIKSTTGEGFDIMVDRVALSKTKDNLLFVNLSKFNNSCRKGEVDKCMDHVMKNGSKQLLGIDPFSIVGAVAITGILLNIIPILRELIFFFYHTRQRVSDYFDIQADLLQMNAENVKYITIKDNDEKEKIQKRQMNIVDKFRKISNFLAIEQRKSEAEATKEIVSGNKKFKTDELLDSVPDSVGSALF